MPQISIIGPLDQPLGTRRLLHDLKEALADSSLSEFGMAVAFAKIGPLYRLSPSIEQWKLKGNKISAIFGYDHNGTSQEALQYALKNFDHVYVTRYKGHSFHPKIYWFTGIDKAIVYIGSNNMTVGGTELNFESCVQLTYELPKEQYKLNEALSLYLNLLPENCVATDKLTQELLNKLISENMLMNETDKSVDKKNESKNKYNGETDVQQKAVLPVKPASSLPAKIFGSIVKTKTVKKKADAIKEQVDNVDITKPLIAVSGLVMQIKPHHNGEIFLSKRAALQNPAFFGMPFTGLTVPKKGDNKGYPQRQPDPIVNVTVYGHDNTVMTTLSKFQLNTVFYTKKSEIRITASPLVKYVPQYSVMVMTVPEDTDIDYDVHIYTPESNDYKKWLDMCNQTMPGGGEVPRKFGWY